MYTLTNNANSKKKMEIKIDTATPIMVDWKCYQRSSEELCSIFDVKEKQRNMFLN